MGQRFPADFSCAECAAILRALLDDFHADHREVRARIRDTAEASGRTVDQMRTRWINLVGAMPADEQQTLMKAHYPRAVEAQRRKKEHETLTGHSVHTHGWRGVFGRAPFGGRLPGN